MPVEETTRQAMIQSAEPLNTAEMLGACNLPPDSRTRGLADILKAAVRSCDFISTHFHQLSSKGGTGARRRQPWLQRHDPNPMIDLGWRAAAAMLGMMPIRCRY